MVWWLNGNEYAWLGEGYMCELWVWHKIYMSYTWEAEYMYMWSRSWHEQQWTWWLVIQWHGFGMRRNTLLMVGNNELVLIQLMINEGWLRMLVWDSYAWYVYPLLGCLYMFDTWSVRNSLKPLGGTSRSCFSGRNIILWPLLVDVHGGAPSI